MRLVFAIGVILLVVQLYACQKGLSYQLNDPPPIDTTSNGSLLIKIASYNSKNDSVVTNYSYNNARKLLGISTSGKDDTITYNSRVLLTRNADGLLVQVVKSTTVGELVPAGLSNLLNSMRLFLNLPGNNTAIETSLLLHYPQGAAAFDYSLQYIQFSGLAVTDSTVYAYQDNRLTTATVYFSARYHDTIVATPTKIAVTTYSYDLYNNLNGSSTQKLADIAKPGAPLQDAAKNTYAYTSNTNPLQLGNEALLYGDEFRNAPNNCMQQIYVTGGVTQQTSSAFGFNANNLPDTAIVMRSPSNKTYREFYYYQ